MRLGAHVTTATDFLNEAVKAEARRFVRDA
jgi:hypothetical protein